jgi:hypothetical protein
MISWAAANEMRWVKPSIATRSPSWTWAAIASPSGTTLDAADAAEAVDAVDAVAAVAQPPVSCIPGRGRMGQPTDASASA